MTTVLLAGDFNASGGEKNLELFFWKCYKSQIKNFPIMKYRRSKDKKMNGSSRHFEFLLNDLVILNGCTQSDGKGDFTCISHIGTSVVDYFVASADLLT